MQVGRSVRPKEMNVSYQNTDMVPPLYCILGSSILVMFLDRIFDFYKRPTTLYIKLCLAKTALILNSS